MPYLMTWILLTAATTAIGAFPITLDPVFSGLAWALIFGLLASTVLVLFVVPSLYAILGDLGLVTTVRKESDAG